MAGAKKYRPPGWLVDVGKRLAWVREQAGLSQDRVGKILGGVRQTTIADYENAKRDPDPYLMVVFCAKFKVTMDYIFRGDVMGCDRQLAFDLMKAHPELTRLPRNTGFDMGTAPLSDMANTEVEA